MPIVADCRCLIATGLAENGAVSADQLEARACSRHSCSPGSPSQRSAQRDHEPQDCPNTSAPLLIELEGFPDRFVVDTWHLSSLGGFNPDRAARKSRAVRRAASLPAGREGSW